MISTNLTTDFVNFLLSVGSFIILLFIHALVFYHKEIYSALTTTTSGRITSLAIILISGLFLVVMVLRMFGVNLMESPIAVIIINGSIHFGLVTQKTFYLDFVYLQAISRVATTLFLVLLAAIYYTVAFLRIDILKFIFYCFCIFLGGFIFLSTTHTVVMFFAYEAILVPSSAILYRYSKTTRVTEAVIFMIAWTQIGAMALFFVLGFMGGSLDFFGLSIGELHLTRSVTSLITLVAFFGFGTKMPIWPFAWWLPEAHVEVGTNFSIVLSGVSIKLAFLGFLRFVQHIGSSDILSCCLGITLIGIIYTALQIDVEIDLKKVVAYQTIIEMHAITIFILMDPTLFCDYVAYTLTTHCWISTIGFLMIDFINKRYHTRNIEHLYGLFAESPRIIKFIFIVVFILNSVPGFAVYTFEFLVLAGGLSNPFNIVIFLFIQFFVVVWSKNIWWTLWGGDTLYHCSVQPFTFTKTEFYFICIILLQLFMPAIGIDLVA